jgi:hypothetical protein
MVHASYLYLGFEVFKAVSVKNAVFCYVALCVSCENRRFGATSESQLITVFLARSSLLP